MSFVELNKSPFGLLVIVRNLCPTSITRLNSNKTEKCFELKFKFKLIILILIFYKRLSCYSGAIPGLQRSADGRNNAVLCLMHELTVGVEAVLFAIPASPFILLQCWPIYNICLTWKITANAFWIIFFQLLTITVFSFLVDCFRSILLSSWLVLTIRRNNKLSIVK